jgi:hypothetical protein
MEELWRDGADMRESAQILEDLALTDSEPIV